MPTTDLLKRELTLKSIHWERSANKMGDVMLKTSKLNIFLNSTLQVWNTLTNSDFGGLPTKFVEQLRTPQNLYFTK